MTIITVAVIFIISALVCYTTAIWSERFAGKLKPWMVRVFTTGFACDIIGTSIMFVSASHRFAFNPHTILGYVALLIMFLHLIWARRAISRGGQSQIYFTRFSWVAWLGWLAAFVTGIPRSSL
jgi:uncharacterized repeat protein (TIGR03987 family)